MQFVPLPRMNPLHPSSFHIFPNACPTDNLYASLPALCICMRIFSLSRGDTTVRDTAPATPPAQKAATTGWDMVSRNLTKDSWSRLEALTTPGSDCRAELAKVSSWFLRPRTADMANTSATDARLAAPQIYNSSCLVPQDPVLVLFGLVAFNMICD